MRTPWYYTLKLLIVWLFVHIGAGCVDEYYSKIIKENKKNVLNKNVLTMSFVEELKIFMDC